MILTIGMIVKNEAGSLDKCLNSLEPLRKAVDSELIIVDTGSTDNTVEIAKKYTYDVRTFEWCNDFSAARNKSMENASGEWFMFIDADEWFEDVSQLINFFNSGEYKKYNSATYIQRNYGTADINGGYSDYDALRLTKILPNTKFVDKIHEWLNTANEPIKKLDDYVHHFGYAEINAGDIEKKRKRNETLLLKSIDEDSKKLSLYFQLFDCYFGFDNEKAIDYARKGIKVNDEIRYNIYAGYVFRKLIAYALLTDKKYEQAVSTINEYYIKRNNDKDIEKFIATDVDASAIDAYANYELGNTDKAISACVKYNSTYANLKAKKHSMAEVLMCPLKFANDNEYVNINILHFQMLFELGKMSDALTVLNRLTFENIVMFAGINKAGVIIESLLDIIKQNADYTTISELLASIKFDDTLAKFFEDAFLSRLYNGKDVDINLISGFFKNVDLGSISPRFDQIVKLYYNLFCGDIKDSHLTYYIDSFDVLPDYLADVLWLAIKNDDDNIIYSVLKKFRRKNIDAYINRMLSVKLFAHDYIYYLENNKCDDVMALSVLNKISENIIYSIDIDDDVCFDLYRQYSKMGFEYLCLISKPEYINDEKIEVMPIESMKQYYCYMGLKYFDANDTKLCTHYMRKAALLDIRLKKVVSAMSSVSSNAKVYNKGVSAEHAEFDMLSKRIKDDIKAYVSVGDNSSASKLLFEYSQINPNDKEINELSKMVNSIIID